MRPEDQRGASSTYTTICRTLIFLTRKTQVLLIKGAPDKRLWANRYNGLGGHLEPGESVYAAARRELREEAGIAAAALALRGVVHITMPQPPGIVLFVFTGTTNEVKTVHSEEGTATWVDFADLGRLPLVEDLPALLPRVLQPGPLVYATYHVTDEGLTIEIE